MYFFDCQTDFGVDNVLLVFALYLRSYLVLMLCIMYYTVCYLTGIFYAVVRQISMLFIDNKKIVFCILYSAANLKFLRGIALYKNHSYYFVLKEGGKKGQILVVNKLGVILNFFQFIIIG